jgi:hypothetical protein
MTMKKQTNQKTSGDHRTSTWRVYQAPWGWSVEIFDGGKQVFSGAMYRNRLEAESAVEKFLLKRFPNSGAWIQLCFPFED